MNIEPGTRVRIAPTEAYPDPWEGTYLKRERLYYDIQWDNVDAPLLHLVDEFEVIDE